MSFLPALPQGGYAGWRLLQRTAPQQQAAFDRQAAIEREAAYFRDRLGKVTRPEQLVGDRRLLQVALTAFGLEGDINNRFFLRKVLEEGTLRPGALALKLSDTRYRAFASAFGFDLTPPRTQVSDFADRILQDYRARGFEAAVGTVDGNLRLALNARREVARIAGAGGSDATQWFSIMGQRPLARVFETAFGLPPSFGTLDIDRQKAVLQSRAAAAFGDSRVSQFSDPDRMEALIRRFLLRAQFDSVQPQSSPASGALSLLSTTLRRL